MQTNRDMSVAGAFLAILVIELTAVPAWLNLAGAQDRPAPPKVVEGDAGKTDRPAEPISSRPEFGVGLATSMQKVFLDELPFPGTFGRTISLSLARNECESAQVVVFAEARNLANVYVTASDLAGDQGTVIPAHNIRLSPVGYVKLPRPAPPESISRKTGWWPDPILTFLKKIDIQQGRRQPFWVRVRTDKDTKPGKYRGLLTIKADHCAPVTIDLAVEVWDFVLPDQPSLPTAVYFGWRFVKAVHETHRKAVSVAPPYGWEDPPVAESLAREYQQFLLDYKLFPTQLYSVSSPDIAFLKRCKQQGRLGIVNILYIDCSKPPEYYLDRLRAIVPELKKEGLYDHAVLYGFDEFEGDQTGKVAAQLRPIKRAFPDLKVMTTVRCDPFKPGSPLKDLIDIWVPEYPGLDPAQAAEYRKIGKQVWKYTCLSPPRPNGYISSPLLEARGLLGADAMRSRQDGWLYWCSNYWQEQTEPMTSGPLTIWNVTNFGPCPPGDGCLMYAGPAGPVPTLRLENYRDGLEDYEYYKILEKLLTAAEAHNTIPADRLKAARDLLAVRWDPYAGPTVLSAERRKLASAILELKPQKR